MTTNYASVRALAVRYGVDPATIWRWVAKGRFPPPVKLGPSVTRWRLDEVEQHEAQLAASRASAA